MESKQKVIASATLQRVSDNGKQTLGVFTSMSKELFVAKSLELPWKNNEHNVSCIPTGKYICKWTRSNRLSTKAGHDVFTYEVLEVPNRAGIRIHASNYYFELLGCVALGDANKDINSDGELDVIHSGKTVTKLAELMNYKDFELTIT